MYDEERCVDLENQYKNIAYNSDEVKKLVEEGNTWSEMWLTFGQKRYPYDKNFLEISNYAKNNNINKSYKLK